MTWGRHRESDEIPGVGDVPLNGGVSFAAGAIVVRTGFHWTTPTVGRKAARTLSVAARRRGADMVETGARRVMVFTQNWRGLFSQKAKSGRHREQRATSLASPWGPRDATLPLSRARARGRATTRRTDRCCTEHTDTHDGWNRDKCG